MAPKIAINQDLKEENVLEELWYIEEWSNLKKFKRKCLGVKRIQEILQCTKSELKDLLQKYNDDAIVFLKNMMQEKSSWWCNTNPTWVQTIVKIKN